MLTEDLYLELEKTISNKLTGTLNYDGFVLKWEYDGIENIHNGLDEHLDVVAHEDKEIITDYLQKYDYFVVSEPEIHDTFVYFYIEQ